MYFDVRVGCTFRAPTELHAVQLMKSSLVELPAMGALYILMKMFLHENGLDKLYQNGGVRPYMLYTFLYLAKEFYMKGCLDEPPNMQGGADESPNLALLLLGFLHFYGSCFKSERYGISCRESVASFSRCIFFAKRREVHNCGYCPIIEKLGFYYPLHPHLLAVEDPLNPSNDLGKISRKYPEIQEAFMQAYVRLISPSSQLLDSFVPAAMADDATLVTAFSRLR